MADKGARWQRWAKPKQRFCNEQENEDGIALDLGNGKSNKEGDNENLDNGGKGEHNTFLNLRRDTDMRVITQHNTY